MSEMCSVCIIRAQRDDDDFLPCSTACFRAALAEAGYQGLMEITRIGAKCYDDGQRDMLDRCREAVAAMPEYAMRDTSVSAIDSLKGKP